MGKRGPKPRNIVDTKWRADLAYAVGLIATDGCLGKDNLHIDLTSKDREQLQNFSRCLGVNFTIGSKNNNKGHNCLRIQFKNRYFYDFLLSIGLTPQKSLTMGKLNVPQEYFFDFLRGSFDGDGCFYSYWDKRWKSSYMFYLTFGSASKDHVLWLRQEVRERLSIDGHISKSSRAGSIYSLRYAKRDAVALIDKMYYTPKVVCLSRKRIKIFKALEIEKKQQKSYSS